MLGLKEVCSLPDRIQRIWLGDRANEDVLSWIILINFIYTEGGRPQFNALCVLVRALNC